MSEVRENELRRGKFTSSRFHELMGIKGLGKTGESYAFEMACDIVMGIDPDDDYVSYDMQKGIDLEPFAFDHFRRKSELEFITVEPGRYIDINQYTGSTPDGIVNGIDPLEIKCPKRGKFLRLVVFGEIDQLYIDQMQHQMFGLKAERAYFYNYITQNGKEYGHQIIVNRDEQRIELMQSRLKEAVELRENFINKLKANL